MDGALWLTGYRKSTGLGYLNGITIATAARDGAGVSPYFDGELFTVYTAARAARAEPISFGRTAKAGERGTGTAAGTRGRLRIAMTSPAAIRVAGPIRRTGGFRP